MSTEKITVRLENGQTTEVVVVSMREHEIEIVLGEGQHSVRCRLQPTRTGAAYAGSVMGREVVYERSKDEVAADLARQRSPGRGSRPRR